MSYIEREPLLEILQGLYDHHLTMYNYAADGATQDCIEAVIEAPTADLVEVVRCKDCKFWGIPHANDIEKSHYCCRDNMWCMPLRFADDFCSYGERRANDGT